MCYEFDTPIYKEDVLGSKENLDSFLTIHLFKISHTYQSQSPRTERFYWFLNIDMPQLLWEVPSPA